MPQDPDDITAEFDDEDEPPVPSRASHRRDAAAFTELADELARGRHTRLPDPPFDETLREAVAESQRFLKNARSRQIRRVAQLLRGAGTIDELRDALAGRTPELMAERARELAVENWRTRMIAEGDPALDAFMAIYWTADRRQLRQLMRQARRSPPDARTKRAATGLLRAIRLVCEENPQPEPKPESPPESQPDPEPESAPESQPDPEPQAD